MDGQVDGGAPAPAPEKMAPTTELQQGAPVDGGAGGEEVIQHEQGQDASQPEPNRARYRFSQLSQERNAALQEAAYWRGLAEGKAAVPSAPAAPAAQAAEGPPEAGNYPGGEFSPEYIRDLSRFEARMEARTALEAERRAMQAEAAFEEGRQRFLAVHQAVASAGDDLALQFVEQIGHRPDGRALADSLAESEYAPLAAQYFARNPQDWRRIAQLPPTRRAVEIDRIGQTVQYRMQQQQAYAAAQAQQPSRPSPTQPAATPQALNGRGAAPALDPERASLAELRARYGFDQPKG